MVSDQTGKRTPDNCCCIEKEIGEFAVQGLASVYAMRKAGGKDQ
jgi:hypothetical protein